MEDKVELTMSQWRAIEKMQDLIFDLQTTVERMSHTAAEQAAAEKLSRRYQKILDQVHPERQEHNDLGEEEAVPLNMERERGANE